MAFIAPPPPGVHVPASTAIETSFRRVAARASRQPVIPVAMALAVALVVVHAIASQVVLSEGAYQLATAGGAVLAFVGARRLDVARRAGWYWIAAGLASSAVAEVIWTVLFLRDGVGPDASVADVFWLASYVALGVGLFVLASPDREERADVDVLLDSATVGVLALLVVWQVSVGETLGDTTTTFPVRALWASYPILDTVLLAMVVRLLLGRRSAAGSLLAVGVLSWLVSDALYMVWGESAAWSPWYDAGWMLAAVTMGLAAFVFRPAPPRPEGPVQGISTWRLALASVPIVAPASVELWGHAIGQDPAPAPLFAASLALATLVFVRLHRFVRSNMRVREALRSRERHFRALAANTSDAVVVVTPDGTLKSGRTSLGNLLADTDLETPTQRAGGLVPGTDVGTLVSPRDPAAFRRLLERAAARPAEVVSDEWPVVAANGQRTWFMVRAVSLQEDPDVDGIVVNLNDITDRKTVEEALTHQALHDALTGLPNRALLRDRLEHALIGGRRRGRTVAVVYLDLDGFKTVNDSLGHDVGDDLLREVTRRLQRVVRAQDTVARLGGDEFAILLEDATHADEEALTVCERIRHALSAPIAVGGREVVVSASLGVAVADAETTPTSLLRNADIAMYQAKNAGRGTWAVYEDVMQVLADQRLQLELDLAGAEDRGELRLVYQPVVELDTGRVVSLEALVRWEHPTLGLLSPDRFVPLAEDTGMIIPVGRWVLETACSTLAAWHRTPGGSALTMAVNVSARQLASDTFVVDVASALSRSGLDPASLVLEMTETALVADVAAATRQLHELRGLGVRLAIDDFGTGYSSLGYLREFPVDILKIDRSFISTITDQENVPALVRGLLDLAATLDLETIAEGVELEVQRDHLRRSSCAMAQGYLFARPMTRADADALISGLPAPVAGGR